MCPMKITNVTVHLLEATGASRIFDLVLLPGMRRDRWKHDLVSMESGVMPVMRVETDEGIVGVCTADAGACGRPHLRLPRTAPRSHW